MVARGGRRRQQKRFDLLLPLVVSLLWRHSAGEEGWELLLVIPLSWGEAVSAEGKRGSAAAGDDEERELENLIKNGWITFEEPPNISTNPLPIHAAGSGSVNMLDTRYPKSLKVPMEKVYQMLIRARYDDIRCCQYHN